MYDVNLIDLSSAKCEITPFPHFFVDSVLHGDKNHRVFQWLDSTTNWYLTTMDFYRQYEFNIQSVQLPEDLMFLTDQQTIEKIIADFKYTFKLSGLTLVGIMAHKLVNGHHIGIHNDFINEEETHRLVLHLNPDWREENGGFLMLFNSEDADDVARVISPVNNSGFGFAISKVSFHAVSKIVDSKRYSIVYTFRGFVNVK